MFPPESQPPGSPMAPDEDTQWMLRLKNGEDAALSPLMTRWQTPLARFIYRSVGDWEKTLDLAQETFVRVYQSRHAYQPDAKFSSWLFSIASNLCRNAARWERRHPTVAMPENAGETLASPERTPSDNAEQNDQARRVKESIQSLPHDLKTVVLLFEYEGFSYQEIAAVLKCSPKAVETRLYRARKLLRDKLERFR